MTLRTRHITVELNNAKVLSDVNAVFEPGKLTVLVGPNGAGKSTLLKTLLGIVEPVEGSVMLDEQRIVDLPAHTRAQHLAYLPQQQDLAWPMPVKTIVALGRFAYGAVPHKLSRTNERIVTQALDDTDLLTFAGRAADTLSGGERARMGLARLLASEATYLLADEPCASLDPFHQHSVMSILRRTAEQGRGVLTVMHDLGLAYRYADTVMVLQGGTMKAIGCPSEVLTPKAIEDVFHVGSEVVSGHLVLMPRNV